MRVFFASDPRTTPGQAELAELAGRFELVHDASAGGGDLIGRFLLQPDQRLPWRAATLIEVSEQGRPELWPFIGPVALW